MLYQIAFIRGTFIFSASGASGASVPTTMFKRNFVLACVGRLGFCSPRLPANGHILFAKMGCFFLFAAFVVLSTQVASTNPSIGGSKYPIVSDADMGMPVCYVRTEDGRVLDLRNLCGEPAKNTVNTMANAADVKRLLATKECAGCNLAGVNLAEANLYFANLTGANLIGANLTGANLVGANLSDGNLANANLSGAKLNGARMIGANLNGASLANANLLGANIINANLNGAQLQTTKMPDGKISN